MREFTVHKARYSKGMMAVHCQSDGTGFKTPAMRLCDALTNRYSHRENAYIMPKSKADSLPNLMQAGWSATLGYGRTPPQLVPPGGNYTDAMSFREAKKHL